MNVKVLTISDNENISGFVSNNFMEASTCAKTVSISSPWDLIGRPADLTRP